MCAVVHIGVRCRPDHDFANLMVNETMDGALTASVDTCKCGEPVYLIKVLKNIAK